MKIYDKFGDIINDAAMQDVKIWKDNTLNLFGIGRLLTKKGGIYIEIEKLGHLLKNETKI